MESQKSELLNRLDRYLKNSDSKMTRDRYLTMCEQLNKEPDPDEIPPDLHDFPDIAVIALGVFSGLGDRVYPEIGFIGKDYTNLPLHIDLHSIEDKELFLEILLYLESRAIEQSQKALKRERDKLKRKS